MAALWSVAPGNTESHVPAPDRLQAWQAAVQASMQHTPSAQWPEPHCESIVQPRPLLLAPPWQVAFASQYSVAAQLSSAEPAGTFTQFPRLPATLHDWHWPVQL